MDPDFIHELFAEFGAVEIRPLFGGAGLFADGVMFGLVSSGEIYLKADAETVPHFEAEGCGPFEYGSKTGRRTIASFRKLPERLYDDADGLAEWAREALAVARLKAVAKPDKPPSRAREHTTKKPATKKPATRKIVVKKTGTKKMSPRASS